jgi:hypothetical protein
MPHCSAVIPQRQHKQPRGTRKQGRLPKVLATIAIIVSQDGATSRFAVARVTLRRGESSGAEPPTKGMVAYV